MEIFKGLKEGFVHFSKVKGEPWKYFYLARGVTSKSLNFGPEEFSLYTFEIYQRKLVIKCFMTSFCINVVSDII